MFEKHRRTYKKRKSRKVVSCVVCLFIGLNATFNNISVISWRSVSLVNEIGVPGENHQPVENHWQTLSQSKCCIEYTSPWTGFELTTLVVLGTDCTASCKSSYHTIMTTTVPYINNDCIIYMYDLQIKSFFTVWFRDCFHYFVYLYLS